MLKHNNSRYLALIVLISAIALLVPLVAGGCGSSQPEPQAQPVVKKVDHITISCTDPAALFDTLTQTLGLPVAWPLSSYPGFTTGGTYCGNVNIETLQFGGSGQASGGTPDFTFIYGIVFESYPLSEVMDEFQQRGADPGDPEDQMREENGQQVKVWTNVTLNGLCTDDYIVYLCEYTQEMEDALEQRAQANPVPLGGIGLVGVKEIVVDSTQPEQTRDLWEMVFAPATMSADGELSFDSGPAILISAGDMDVITGIVLEVEDLQAARDFLAQNGLLGEVSNDRVSIDPEKVQGLSIVLVEK
ncbi:MAG: hypothetical protein C4536_02980 [Actinobacteria bacterium]|jgi:catechol 2,3-dioxygenase-like lactoylglutathione lyase family enzyme|nr:MAG: hypothetical protein C4536_02980 [Actinomycetota bacterium]